MDGEIENKLTDPSDTISHEEVQRGEMREQDEGDFIIETGMDLEGEREHSAAHVQNNDDKETSVREDTVVLVNMVRSVHLYCEHHWKSRVLF